MPSPTSPRDDRTSPADDDREVALDRALLREFLKERVGFQFAIAVIDDDRAREALIGDLTRDLAANGIAFQTLDLRQHPDDVVLLTALKEALAKLGNRPAAFGVQGIDRHLDFGSGGTRDKATSLLADANFQRDAFPDLCPVPVVLWVTSLALPAIARLAPDLWHWRTATFDLCEDPPDTPWVDRLESIVPRPEKVWEAQTKEKLHQRIALLKRILDDVGPGQEERRARLLIEFAGATYDAGDFAVMAEAADEAIELSRRIGDVRLESNARSQRGRVASRLGDPEEALRHFEQALRLSESIGDNRSRAVDLGDIARIKAQRGAIDEALALYEQALTIYKVLGDQRGLAITLGDIARIKVECDAIDDALALLVQKLAICEELSDRRSRVVTLGDIARIMAQRGAIDDALALHEERLAVYEELGDRRNRAVTLGDIAHIKASRGAIDEALALHEERLTINENLGAKEEQANALWSIAVLLIERANDADQQDVVPFMTSALDHLAKAYSLVMDLGHAAGIAIVGLDLARLIAAGGVLDEARAIATRSRDLFAQLKRPDYQAFAQALLDRLPPPTSEPSPPPAG